MTNAVLVDLAERAFSKSPWHSLIAALDGISDAAFNHVPDKHGGFPWMNGSVRDIVYHVAGDKLVQLDQAYGDGTMNWENVPIDKDGNLIDQLKASQTALTNAIRSANDVTKKVSSWGGKRMPAHDFFLMLIEHDLYHAGQIRYIRNLVE